MYGGGKRLPTGLVPPLSALKGPEFGWERKQTLSIKIVSLLGFV